MELKKTTETVHRVKYYDLDDFIKEACGVEVESKQIDCWGNDTQHRFKVTPIDSDADAKEWEKIKTEKFAEDYSLRTILNGLCTDGKLESGVYLVIVSW